MASCSDDVCHDDTDVSLAQFHRGRRMVSRGFLRAIQQSSIRGNLSTVFDFKLIPLNFILKSVKHSNGALPFMTNGAIPRTPETSRSSVKTESDISGPQHQDLLDQMAGRLATVLPTYARPLFIRISQAIEMTAVG
ncbi:unnamed protein product [Protopolystoma xenopodis]|uniref:Uncharacterized protein n=1 Tax=Protopolystoma xenopodis TaxID=117903 RepID=A0A448WML9_9PLAT|nr:unnamed protein product [Protopolystoma xenopodis]